MLIPESLDVTLKTLRGDVLTENHSSNHCARNEHRDNFAKQKLRVNA